MPNDRRTIYVPPEEQARYDAVMKRAKADSRWGSISSFAVDAITEKAQKLGWKIPKRSD